MASGAAPSGVDGVVGVNGVVQLGEGFTANPYVLYDLLRRERPVTRAQIPQTPPFWLVTRHQDVRAALADPRLYKDTSALARMLELAAGGNPRAARPALDVHDHMLNSDPPKHTRLRKLVSKAFTGRAIAQLRPRIQGLAETLAEAMVARLAAGRDSVDLIKEFAFPLPMTVICEILGVPDDRRTEFGVWSHTILSSSSAEEHIVATVAMGDYLAQLVADKREHPGEDILSAILAPDENADRLTDTEATSMASLLLVAGHETTVNLIGNGTLALLRHPEQLAHLRADPALLPGAVDEFLRLDSPVNVATTRFTAQPVTIGGTTIPAGQVVLLGIGSANRDPSLFERPDDLDIERDRTGSLAFGHGIHYCLGAPLARLEGEIAFRVLLDKFPTLALAAEPDDLAWHNSILLRGLAHLPVRAD
ncbi:MAG TPA: cytochrome P450 [Pseudonocardiaceae bacterium]|jgi:cytochrome P450|nr:cytochrome P450 [Pseudonocardiaceae bacterium]